MLGDWVSVSGTPMRIAALGTVKAGFLDGRGEMFYHGYDSIEPIQLTAEILEKNGINLNPQGSYRIGRYASIDLTGDGRYFAYLNTNTNTNTDDPSFLRHCGKYVHELQHAFRLCGIEKEIDI